MMLALVAALSLSAQPPFLRLDSDVRAVVRVVAAQKPVLSVSAGHFEKLHRAADGAFEADYVPPEEPMPRVAIVTAIAAGEAGWLSIPLYGEGDALVKTRRHAKITVQIGEQSFGPAEADETGNALVPVIVPPGVNEAYHGKRAIDLHVPQTQTLQLALALSRAMADREERIPIYVAVVTPKGLPRSAAPVSISASRGQVSAAREVSPGLYESMLIVPAGAAGLVTVLASLGDARQFVSKVALALEAGPARSISLSAESERAIAGGEPVALRVSAQDAAGNASPEPLQFAASFGEVRAQAAGVGAWSLLLSLPPSFQGQTSLEVIARGAQARGSKTLQLLPAAPRSVAFAGPPRSVRADGHSNIRLPLEVRDAFGNQTVAHPEVSAEQGTAGFESDDGRLYATYVPPLLHEPSATQLDARLGGSTARANLVLLPQIRSAAFSPKLGVLSNFAGFTAPLAGIEAAFRSDRLGPQLGFALEADFTSRSHDESLPALGDDGASASSRMSLLLMHASLTYRYELNGRTTMWLAAGPSAAAYWTRVLVTGAPAQTGTALAPGVQAAFGVERRLGFAVPFLEMRAGWITRPELATVGGPLRTLSLCAGARFEAL